MLLPRDGGRRDVITEASSDTGGRFTVREIEHRRQLLVCSEFLVAAEEKVEMKTRTRTEATEKN